MSSAKGSVPPYVDGYRTYLEPGECEHLGIRFDHFTDKDGVHHIEVDCRHCPASASLIVRPGR